MLALSLSFSFRNFSIVFRQYLRKEIHYDPIPINLSSVKAALIDGEPRKEETFLRKHIVLRNSQILPMAELFFVSLSLVSFARSARAYT